MHVRRPILSMALVLLAFSGCAHSREPSAASPAPASAPVMVPPDRPASIALWVKAIPQSREAYHANPSRPVTLRSGDRIAFDVTLSRSAYFYMGYRSSDGSCALLFPISWERQEIVVADSLYRAGIFRLDQNVGQEDVFFYVSKRQLTRKEVLAFVRADSQVVQRSAEPRFPELDGVSRKYFAIIHKK